MASRDEAAWCSVDACDNGQTPDAVVAIGVQECVVIPERYAAVGLTPGSEHEGMREQTCASVDGLFAANGIQSQRLHAVKQRLARRQLVKMRRRHAPHSDLRGAWIVKAGAETGMRFQLAAIGQVNHVRGDVVDGG